MNSLIRCYYHNLGYCKEKTNCIYLHNDEDCETKCIKESCLKDTDENSKMEKGVITSKIIIVNLTINQKKY